MDIEQTTNSFDMKYVLRLTARNMRKSIDVSIRKTFERIKEFSDDKEKSSEIFETLAKLHEMRKQVEEFQAVHKNIKR